MSEKIVVDQSVVDQSLAEQLSAHVSVFEQLSALLPAIEQVAGELVKVLQAGNKILLAGNGGSAADAQHIAAELTGRYLRTRKGLPAIALTTDTSALTAIGNDFGYDQVFVRQLEALGREGDALIVYSTSGNSGNIIEAIALAKAMGVKTIALTGDSGGKIKPLVDLCLCMPSAETPRIQEAHAFVGHALCDLIDREFT